MSKACTNESMNELLQALDLFRCCQDEDVESFLRTKALKYETENICRVYLILNEERFDSGILDIIAYFTLSQRSLGFSPDVSKTTIKKIARYKDRIVSEFILIGQLGKYKSNERTAEISINEIMDYILEIVCSIEQYIPCRSLLIECSESVHKKGIYEKCKYPFKLLQYDNGFYQYYRIL